MNGLDKAFSFEVTKPTIVSTNDENRSKKSVTIHRN